MGGRVTYVPSEVGICAIPALTCYTITDLLVQVVQVTDRTGSLTGVVEECCAVVAGNYTCHLIDGVRFVSYMFRAKWAFARFR